MRELTFTAAFPFGGAGAGARGFLDAAINLPNLGVSARFECVGGVDFDPLACADFEYLTGTPELCADVQALTVADVRRVFGTRAPDCVFMSPPCKGASGLLSAAKSKSAKYEAMNELALVWTRLMLAAWADQPPGLVLLENVPRLKTRAPKMLREIRKLLRGAGYALSDGFHDCGELGGLAQHRRRYLLVARHQRRFARARSDASAGDDGDASRPGAGAASRPGWGDASGAALSDAFPEYSGDASPRGAGDAGAKVATHLLATTGGSNG